MMDNDADRREEAIAKAGAEGTLTDDDLARLEREDIARQTGGIPESAEQLRDIEAPEINLPPIGTPVVYHSRNGAMRRGMTDFPATVLGHDRDGRTVQLYIVMDADDTIFEQYVDPCQDGEIKPHSFSLVGGSVDDDEIKKLWTELDNIRAMILGEYVDPPRPLMEMMADFTERLTALERPKAKK
jgi:hypothetical protein